LSRRESSGKSLGKKYKHKISSSPSSSAVEELPTYDDISDLMTNQELLTNDEEEPKYMCPPPPRPISATKLPPIPNNPDNRIEELYDDVNTCREQYIKTHGQVMFYNAIAIFIITKTANFPLFNAIFVFSIIEYI